MSRVQHNGSNKNIYKENTKTRQDLSVLDEGLVEPKVDTCDVQMNQIHKYKPLIAFQRKQYLSQDKPGKIKMKKYLHVVTGLNRCFPLRTRCHKQGLKRWLET